MIEFEIRFLVERNRDLDQVPPAYMNNPAYLEPTRLTEPDARLTEAASCLAHLRESVDLAERINEWVWQAMTYARDVTDVETTAATALALGRGVCQDYTHVMLALCRLLGLPARYISGHLLGERGTHAWVEVLAPDPATPSRTVVQAFDPTHGSTVPPGLHHRGSGTRLRRRGAHLGHLRRAPWRIFAEPKAGRYHGSGIPPLTGCDEIGQADMFTGH